MSNALDYEPVPGTIIPYPGSAAATQKRNEFLAALQEILGDTRLLWLPNGTDTTTSTESSRYAGVITWDATVASRYSPLGSLWAQDFNGTAHEGDIPDADRYSFGDGAVDQAFSIVALCKPDVNNALMYLVAKTSSLSVYEWSLGLTTTGLLRLECMDANTSNSVSGTAPSALGTNRILVGATYNGSGADTGISLFQNAASVAVTRVTTGTYVALENSAALVHLGARYTTKAAFFNGSIDLLAVCAKALTIDDHWAIKDLVNGITGLTL